MRFIGKILITALSAIIVSYVLPGVHIAGGFSPISLAIVLALLNSFVKPLLIILTIPITIITFGIFLLVINVIIIKLADSILPGFKVDNWWAALWFSLLLSLVSYFLDKLVHGDKKEERKKIR